jgi:hypothetical protein
MLHEYTIPKFLWAEAINMAWHVVNRVSLHPLIKKISYELWIGRKSNLSYFRVFDSKYFVLNEPPKVNKFDSKSIEGVFVGYSSTSKVYKIYIPTLQIVIESVHVKFEETINQAIIVEDVQEPPTSQEVPITMNGEQIIEIAQQEIQNGSTTEEKKSQMMQEEHNVLNDDIGVEHILPPQDSNHQVPTDLRKIFSHPLSSVIGDPRECVRTRSKMNKMIVHCAFVSQLEPKIFKDANNDSYWICAMQEELNQFEKNQV